MKITHKIKIFFIRFRWYFEMVYRAVKHAKEVDNYRFLTEIQTELKEKYLKIQRVSQNNPELPKIKEQLDLVDKIINYVQIR